VPWFNDAGNPKGTTAGHYQIVTKALPSCSLFALTTLKYLLNRHIKSANCVKETIKDERQVIILPHFYYLCNVFIRFDVLLYDTLISLQGIRFLLKA